MKFNVDKHEDVLAKICIGETVLEESDEEALLGITKMIKMINASVLSQIGYLPLIWMLIDRNINNK